MVLHDTLDSYHELLQGWLVFPTFSVHKKIQLFHNLFPHLHVLIDKDQKTFFSATTEAMNLIFVLLE